MTSHPMRVLELQTCWAALVDTVSWIDTHQQPDMYLRQVDVPGVDTKFIEQHRGVLANLLDVQLGVERIDLDTPRSDFTGRYGFRKKPAYVRFRLLSGDGDGARLGSGRCRFTELSVRAGELAAAPPGITTVYVVENETTYLAFPAVDGAMVILGGGYAVSTLAPLVWLAGADLVYWGDIGQPL
jgi:hypothetical protein